MQDLREFYNDSAKPALIEKLLLSYLASMDKEMTLAPADKEEQDPTVYLWLLYFISHHYMYLRDFKTALVYVNKAIEHTPTLLELYTLKGKICYKAGDTSIAAELFEEARLMDTADRAINAISALYQLKAGKVDEGEEIMSIFFKDCGYESTVMDNQCIWFEQTNGTSRFRIGEYRTALKQFSYVMGHLTDMVDDQYDYYLYSLRKFTLASFEGLMTFNDHELYQYKPILKATTDLVRLVARVDKNRESITAGWKPEYEAYLVSDKYATLLKDIENAVVDEEEYKKDTDPDGYHKFNDLVDNKFNIDDFVARVAKINPECVLV